MNDIIKSYAKRLKLSWIKENFDEVEAASNQEYLLELFEAEIQQREERRMNLLLTQATLQK
ncbi:mobile element protein [Mesobacillus boroniphilus JCM 21738]|uniref:Mobile element protein n=1 Tax=Mesobacillus boroniphilus JCM 21738 TaxID=1294265 RepID=W4RXJ4_9BACI|nr:mobile element protein [Mesobacillus boroniphilus JCM 21738]